MASKPYMASSSWVTDFARGYEQYSASAGFQNRSLRLEKKEKREYKDMTSRTPTSRRTKTPAHANAACGSEPTAVVMKFLTLRIV